MSRKIVVPLLVTVGVVGGAAALAKAAKPKPPAKKRAIPPVTDEGAVFLPSGATVDFANCSLLVDGAVADEWVKRVAWPWYLRARTPVLSRDEPPPVEQAFYIYLKTIADKTIPEHCKPGGRYLDLADQLMATAACAIFQNLIERGELLSLPVDCTDPMIPWNQFWADTFYEGAEGNGGLIIEPVPPGPPFPPPFPPLPPPLEPPPEPPAPPIPGDFTPTDPGPGPDPGPPPPTPVITTIPPTPPPPGPPGPPGKIDIGICGPTRIFTPEITIKTTFQTQKTKTINLFPRPKTGCIYRLAVGVCVRSGSGAHFGILGAASPGDTPIYDDEGFPNLRQFVSPIAWKTVVIARVIVHQTGNVTVDETGRHRPMRRAPMNLCKNLPNAWPRPRGGDSFYIGTEGGYGMSWKSVPEVSLEQYAGTLRIRVKVTGYPMFVLQGGVIYADSTWITPIDVLVRAKLSPITLL